LLNNLLASDKLIIRYLKDSFNEQQIKNKNCSSRLVQIYVICKYFKNYTLENKLLFEAFQSNILIDSSFQDIKMPPARSETGGAAGR